MTMIFDSHAHYDCEAFDADRDELLASMRERKVRGIINAASDAVSAARSVELAQRFPFVWAAVGIHPEEAGKAEPGDLDVLRCLTAKPRVVAVGEIGLDYHYEDACPRERQISWFRRQLELAAEHKLPVIIHDRDAHEDTLRLLQEYRPKGVLHCFSGSVEMLREVTALGLYIGLGGVVTFKNARRPVEAAQAVPADRLLLETDAPYMAPVPFRGQRCDSAMIAVTAERIAQLRGISTEDLLEKTTENTCRLFGIRLPC